MHVAKSLAKMERERKEKLEDSLAKLHHCMNQYEVDLKRS